MEIGALNDEEAAVTNNVLHSLASATSTLAGVTCDPHLRVTNLIELDKGLFMLGPHTAHSSLHECYASHHSITMPDKTLCVAGRDARTPEEAAAAQSRAAASMQRPENTSIQNL